MFIDRYLGRPRRGSEGRNETGLVLVTLSSAPPNRAVLLGPFSYKHVTPNGVKPSLEIIDSSFLHLAIRNPKSEIPLLVPKRHERIDCRCASRWNQNGHSCNYRK